MAKHKTMMTAAVVDEGDGKITVRLGVTDEHVSHCPTCLALYALRLSSAFLNAIERMRSGDDDSEDDADEPSQHALH